MFFTGTPPNGAYGTYWKEHLGIDFTLKQFDSFSVIWLYFGQSQHCEARIGLRFSSRKFNLDLWKLSVSWPDCWEVLASFHLSVEAVLYKQAHLKQCLSLRGASQERTNDQISNNEIQARLLLGWDWICGIPSLLNQSVIL